MVSPFLFTLLLITDWVRGALSSGGSLLADLWTSFCSASYLIAPDWKERSWQKMPLIAASLHAVKLQGEGHTCSGDAVTLSQSEVISPPCFRWACARSVPTRQEIKTSCCGRLEAKTQQREERHRCTNSWWWAHRSQEEGLIPQCQDDFKAESFDPLQCGMESLKPTNFTVNEFKTESRKRVKAPCSPYLFVPHLFHLLSFQSE